MRDMHRALCDTPGRGAEPGVPCLISAAGQLPSSLPHLALQVSGRDKGETLWTRARLIKPIPD